VGGDEARLAGDGLDDGDVVALGKRPQPILGERVVISGRVAVASASAARRSWDSSGRGRAISWTVGSKNRSG
jgi:hypothetical protein